MFISSPTFYIKYPFRGGRRSNESMLSQKAESSGPYNSLLNNETEEYLYVILYGPVYFNLNLSVGCKYIISFLQIFLILALRA